MLMRIREAFATLADVTEMQGPVEVDETYVGGLERNRHARDRKHLGRGPVGKTPVVGARDRATGKVAAEVVDTVHGPTLRGFVDDHAADGAAVYTDGATAYRGRPNHEAVHHSIGEYVRYADGDHIDTNGIESLWSTLKRAHKGVYHKLSAKHLQRYVEPFAAKRNIRDANTIDQMAATVAGMFGRSITYAELTANPAVAEPF